MALSLEFSDELHTPEIERAVEALEARIREKHSEAVALFVKPQSRKRFRDAARSSGRGAVFAGARGTDRAAREGDESASSR